MMAFCIPCIRLLCVIIISALTFLNACSARPLMAPSARMLVLVSSPQPSLSYHGGPLLTGPRLRLHLLWYGAFTSTQQGTITDFIASFQANSSPSNGATTVAAWWQTSQLYKDASNKAAAAQIGLGHVFTDAGYSRGKNLTNGDLEALVGSLYTANKKTRKSSMYVVFTADDVGVPDFCMSSCGSHEVAAGGKMPFIWVGNAGTQCPGLCAWPFAVEEYGPPGPPLKPPSGDVAADGMVINLATLLAGVVTNPYASGYYQGDTAVPLEAGSACQGKFGPGSYPGYAGTLLTNTASGASFNAVGMNGREFLLPALWNPSTLACQTAP